MTAVPLTSSRTGLDDRLDALVGGPDVRAGVATLLRSHYDAARDKIALRLAAGLGGVEVARQYSAAADEILIALWRFTTETLYPSHNPTEAEKLTLIAVGGYGRGVLAPFSDLDLLFLRPWKTTARTETVAEFVLYVLWDLGLKIGSSARSVDECLSLSRTDMTVRTALLEGRWLAGDQHLGEDFLRRFRGTVTNADPRPFIAESRHRATPVRPIVERPPLGLGDFAAVRAQPLAAFAVGDIIVKGEKQTPTRHVGRL